MVSKRRITPLKVMNVNNCRNDTLEQEMVLRFYFLQKIGFPLQLPQTSQMAKSFYNRSKQFIKSFSLQLKQGVITWKENSMRFLNSLKQKNLHWYEVMIYSHFNTHTTCFHGA